MPRDGDVGRTEMLWEDGDAWELCWTRGWRYLGERMRGGKAAWEQQNLWQFCFGRRVEELGAEQERGQG